MGRSGRLYQQRLREMACKCPRIAGQPIPDSAHERTFQVLCLELYQPNSALQGIYFLETHAYWYPVPCLWILSKSTLYLHQDFICFLVISSVTCQSFLETQGHCAAKGDIFIYPCWCDPELVVENSCHWDNLYRHLPQ